jgi:hypothetical protein
MCFKGKEKMCVVERISEENEKEGLKEVPSYSF